MEPPTQSAEQPLRVFISYSRRDAGAAIWLRQRLEAEGVEVFRDIDDTLPGEEWWNRLTSLISLADSVVFLLSPRSAASKVCADEVAHASALHKRLIPVVIEDVDWSLVPVGLASVHGTRLTPDDTGEAAFKQLREALHRDIEWLREHTRVGERARQWQRRNRDAAELLVGQALADAEQWLTRQPDAATSPTAEQHEFIAASREAERVASEARLHEIERQQRELAEQRDRAEQSLSAARKTASAMASGLVGEFRDIEGVSRDFVRRIVDKANDLVDALAAGGQSSIELTIDKIKVLSDSVHPLLNTGKLVEASDSADRALRMAQEAAAAHPAEPRCLNQLAVTWAHMGDVRRAAGDLPGALEAFQEFLSTGQALSASAPQHLGYRDYVALAHERCGHALVSQGRHDDAEQHIAANVELCEKMADEAQGQQHYQIRLAEAQAALGQHLHVRGRFAEALAAMKKGYEVQFCLSQAAPSDTNLAYALSACHFRIGTVQLDLRDLPAASSDFELCADIRNRLVQSDASNLSWHFGLVSAQSSLADVLLAESKTDAAMTAYAAAIFNLEDLVRRSPQDLSYQRKLADCLARSSRDSRPGADKRKSLNVLHKAAETIAAVLRASPSDAAAQSIEKFIAAELARQGKTRAWSLWR